MDGRKACVMMSVLLMSACTTAHLRKVDACERSFSPLKLYAADIIRIALPPDSTLAVQNIEDAEYWTWKTNIGDVSVSLIGGIARTQMIIARSDYCTIVAKRTRFRVYRHAHETIAVSDAMMANGSGMLVRVDTKAESDFAIASSIIESIEYVGSAR